MESPRGLAGFFFGVTRTPSPRRSFYLKPARSPPKAILRYRSPSPSARQEPGTLHNRPGFKGRGYLILYLSPDIAGLDVDCWGFDGGWCPRPSHLVAPRQLASVQLASVQLASVQLASVQLASVQLARIYTYGAGHGGESKRDYIR